MEKTIKGIGWDNANENIPQVLVGARDRATLNKGVGSLVKVTRKQGRNSHTIICAINPIFREHIGHAMLNTHAAQKLNLGTNVTAIGHKISLDPRVTETEAQEFRAMGAGAGFMQYIQAIAANAEASQ